MAFILSTLLLASAPDGGQPSMDNVEWTLWHLDTFDRDSSPSEEGKGRGLVAGLALLWKKYLAEGVDAEGRRATFTDFTLRWGKQTMGETAAISVEALPEPARSRPGVVNLLPLHLPARRPPIGRRPLAAIDERA